MHPAYTLPDSVFFWPVSMRFPRVWPRRDGEPEREREEELESADDRGSQG
jgi:hypothetical protein